MGMWQRIKNVFRVRKHPNGEDGEQEKHEHEWLSIGVYKSDYSMEPTVVVVCECGVWTTTDLNHGSRVSDNVNSWAFRSPEKILKTREMLRS